MPYSAHSTVRPIAGRLALDFINTANWSDDGRVVEEKISTMADLDVWMATLELPDAALPRSMEEVYALRTRLRSVFLSDANDFDFDLSADLSTPTPDDSGKVDALSRQPILTLVAVSALSVMSDPRERRRVKTCPGANCGWLFLDETKNGRRKWCIMETCGNRAKAARNYARKASI